MTHRSVEDRLRPYIAHAVNLGLDDPDAILTPREQALRELAETAIAILRGQHPEKGVHLSSEEAATVRGILRDHATSPRERALAERLESEQ